MKIKRTFRNVLFIAGGFFCSSFIHAQNKLTSMQKLSALAEESIMLDFFKDFFVDLGVRVKDRGEEFTVHRGEGAFVLTEGINESEVDYVIEINEENIDSLVHNASDQELDEHEVYRILKVFFTPLTAQSLKNPIMTKNIPRWINEIENNIHVYLLSPNPDEFVSHTLIYINREWIVIPGIYGTPKRTFKLNSYQALEYQKRAFEVIRASRKKEWRKFKKWYLQWRKEVSE